MRTRTIVLLSAVGVVALIMQAAVAFQAARHFFAPRQANNNNIVAFAPVQVDRAFPDDMIAIPGQAAAQPCPPEELQQVRRPAVETGAYKLSAPVTHGNLTVFFIHGEGAVQDQKVITLQDAVSQNLAVVHDTGFSLTVDNHSNMPLFIQGGDIVKGGNQDRVLPYDYLIPAGAMRSPVAAFCVEAGRSRPRGNELSSSFQVSSEQLPTRSLKLAALVRRSQADVWSGVSQTQKDLSRNVGGSVQAVQSQTSLQLTLEHPRVQQAAQPFIQNLMERTPPQDNIIGFAVAINGKIQSADVYASPDLFRALWPKLLQASAVAALAEQQPDTRFDVPSAAAIQAFLAAPEQGQAYRQTVAGRTHLIRQESAQNVLLETCDGAQANLVVHRCFLAK